MYDGLWHDGVLFSVCCRQLILILVWLCSYADCRFEKTKMKIMLCQYMIHISHNLQGPLEGYYDLEKRQTLFQIKFKIQFKNFESLSVSTYLLCCTVAQM